jgi:two-component system uhpT operon response regulator UhpA
LTRREKEIARLVCDGRVRREVVAMLGISPKTFDAHRYDLLRKLGLSNEVQLVRRALAAGWVELVAGDYPAPT